MAGTSPAMTKRDFQRRARGKMAITSKIIPPDMSAPQNPVRLVDERWFGRQSNRA